MHFCSLIAQPQIGYKPWLEVINLGLLMTAALWGSPWSERAALANPVSLDGTTPGSLIDPILAPPLLNTCASDCTIRSAAPVLGDYLLHSFSQFNVNPGVTVTFDSGGVANTLARVTGSDLSRIEGNLRLVNGENLFLINPNGLIFEASSTLDPGYLTSEKESGASTSENVITTRHSAVCNDAPDPNRV